MTSNEAPTRRSCAAQDIHQQLLADSPGYRAARIELEGLTQELQTSDAVTRREVARIAVVVHVVWNTEEQNISDAQIASQIDVLNQDFRATNADLDIVPSVFGRLISDAKIEFYLATTDPDGNPTTGVTRRSTLLRGFAADDNVKRDSDGGVDPWPTDRYLNIWVCPLVGGLLGYAQFPGGAADTDGVVVTTTAFGTIGTATAPFNLGRTATHEVGHYLNLFHIWGDEDGNQNPCSLSDLVDDTPNQADPNGGIPTFPHISCNNGPDGDLFYDYMDYTDDAGMVMFTHGQAARMSACLESTRKSLWAAEVRH